MIYLDYQNKVRSREMEEYKERLTKLKAKALQKLINKLEVMIHEPDVSEHNHQLFTKWYLLAIKEQDARRLRQENYLRYH